ncbi:transcription antiterminator [Enterococcus faecium]|uniref:BglG family transcription antiterminator n=1 Tax=Enterococcus faecium TaxID=1352 RepID=UPI000CF35AED|nr:PRD domain-containing protein [Enterococcus faecium]EME3595564.1 BglG family transcription antiterminator [Enterococcus faecium]PQH05874.1 transcription antiterminator BglG [Enterococcus faecium]
MKQKEKLLLRYLIDHKKEYVTSQRLASELLLSDRTIRNYLQRIKELVEKNGGKIIAKPGYGYQLHILQRLTFDLFLSRQEIVPGYAREPQGFYESEDRQKYILNQLLLEDAILFMDDLAEELYISRSSLTKDMQEIKERLIPYSLKIVSKHGQGTWIEGEERNRRHFIMDTFFGNHYGNSLKEYLGQSRFFPDISFEELVIIILDETREAKLKVSDFIIQNLTLHLALGIKRLREGFEIKELGIEQEVSKRVEYQVAQRIVQRIEVIAGVSFPEEEVAYLTLHFMAKSNHKENQNNQELSKELAKVLKRLSQEFHFSLVEDLQLFNGLLDHLSPMMIRLSRGIRIENPLTEEIKKENLKVFDAVKRHFSNMPALKNYTINEDEWAYLALHLMAALEKERAAHKLHALIICATGYGSAQLLKNRVVSEFGKNITVVSVKGYYEINETTLKGIDLIISSIDLSTMFFKIPVLHVSIFLNEDDVRKIRKVIGESIPYHSSDRPIPAFSLQQKKQIYTEQLSEKFFKTYTYEPKKEEILHDLLQKLSINEEEGYIREMRKQIQQRENMGQIIFSDTVAVPHPAVPVGIETKVAVALIPSGMQWDQYQEIHFVFLVSPSYIENEGITVVTKAIVRLVDQLKVQQEILAEPIFENFSSKFIKLIE